MLALADYVRLPNEKPTAQKSCRGYGWLCSRGLFTISNVRRLLTTGKIFLVAVRLRNKSAMLAPDEFPVIISAIEEPSRRHV